MFHIFVLSFWGVALPAFAQVTGNSPYTGLGVGEIYNGAFAQQMGLGGSSVSYSPTYFISGQNPALLAGNVNLIFESGVAGQYKQIQSTAQSQLDLGGGLLYMSMAFPITHRWVSSMGIAPYSMVNYENRFRQRITNSDFSADYLFKGSGGIGTVYWANGFKLNKQIYAGLKASYLYGTTSQEISTRLFTNTPLDYNIALNEKFVYSGLLLEPAVALKIPLNNKERFLNIGAVYSLQSNVSTRKFASLEQRTQNDEIIFSDTLQNLNENKGKTILPARYTIGISLEQQYQWAIVADFSTQDWTQFSSLGISQNLIQGYSVHLGGEWVPDYTALTGYFKRVIYRVGINYTQLPFQLQNQQIKDIALHWGISFPISRNSSLLNFGFALGQRGMLANELVRERFFRFSFGVSINDRKFQRRRLD
ncbi:MAG: hypothetical protein NZ551_03015 [Microscillaceae bacterium]|nr:hypothetical protein [Microscillaceae bacterium]MDW8460159.1 hypothetical protein [Cytophagales bacterium]